MCVCECAWLHTIKRKSTHPHHHAYTTSAPKRTRFLDTAATALSQDRALCDVAAVHPHRAESDVHDALAAPGARELGAVYPHVAEAWPVSGRAPGRGAHALDEAAQAYGIL